MFKIKIPLIIAVLLVAVAGCSSGVISSDKEEEYSKITGGSTSALPNFILLDVNGKQVSLESFKGKKVFVNLWASWCPPCRAEMPSIQKLYEKTASQNVQFVLLALDNDFTTSLQFINKTGFTFPVYYPGAALPSLFNVEGIPATFIFNEKGELVKHISGGANYDSKEFLKLLSN
ncbi:TlpA family protein disulfide reductase [Flavihumibacter sp. UBA7668]|uniref:TlpA family protein disulfide reductase n=1 Tax=Flavihumibacter sp. UBA7668 TaxID=1946542 RepID=UPI0025C6C402|nr:TlpA disulfide reductase family protein [Flavihumibacter sp. UBA7668]